MNTKEISKQIAERIKKERVKAKSEAYHKAKADGSNPELVKAVEELLTPKENAIQEQEASSVPIQLKAEGSQEVQGTQPESGPKEVADKGEKEALIPKEFKPSVESKKAAKAFIGYDTLIDKGILPKAEVKRTPIEVSDETELLIGGLGDLLNQFNVQYTKGEDAKFSEAIDYLRSKKKGSSSIALLKVAYGRYPIERKLNDIGNDILNSDGSLESVVEIVYNYTKDFNKDEELTAEEKSVSKESNLTEDNAKRAKKSSPKRSRKSKDIAEIVEVEAKDVESSQDRERAEDIIVTGKHY